MTYDNSYAVPYRSPEELRAIRDQVLKAGLHSDPLVDIQRDDSVCGLNVTAAWPLPAGVAQQYDQLSERLGALPGQLYLYPFATTHITIATCVDFKKNDRLSVSALRELAEPMLQHLSDFALRISSPKIRIGPPILASNAAFLPVIDCDGQLAALRSEAMRYCRSTGGVLADASAARGFHSTILRFQATPPDALQFASEFSAIAASFSPVEARLQKALVTLELKPYMRKADTIGVLTFDSEDSREK